jgi:hypothetical protein
LPFEPDDRFRLLAAPLVDLAAGLDFFVELALVDFDLGDELGRAGLDPFFRLSHIHCPLKGGGLTNGSSTRPNERKFRAGRRA